MENLFEPISVDDNYLLLAKHMPLGKFWQKVFDKDSNIGKLLLGLASGFYRFQVLIKELYDEMDPRVTIDLLEEWEKSVSIPDEIFSNAVNGDSRRTQVYQKYYKFGGVQKDEDFVRVAEVFGFYITCIPGKVQGSFPATFPLIFSANTKTITHTIIINLIGYILPEMRFPIGFPYIFGDYTESQITGFPLTFPLPFSAGNITFLQRIFDSLAPSNVHVIIKRI